MPMLEQFLPLYYFFYVLLFLVVVERTIRLFRRWRTPSTGRLIAGNLALFLGLLGVVFLVGEGYFLFGYDETDGYGRILTHHRWQLRHVQRNRYGLRDYPLPVRDSRDEGGPVVAVLGDSFAFGQGVEKVERRFSNILQRELRERYPEARVCNIADMGWTTRDELIRLRMFDSAVHFDMVLLAYCLNDLDDLVTFPDSFRDSLNEELPGPIRAITQRSFFLDFIVTRVRLLQLIEMQDQSYFETIDQAHTGAIWAQQAERLDAIVAYCREQGIELAVVTFPFFSSPWDRYGCKEAHRVLSGYWSSRGIPQLDLLEIYRAVDPSELIVNPLDHHPNERAHAMAAEAISSHRLLAPVGQAREGEGGREPH